MVPATSAQTGCPPRIWLSGGIVTTIAFDDTDVCVQGDEAVPCDAEVRR